ncbi:uncharacterized protein LOC141972398 isoform X2 [Athene noctua]|uniref:uncharacterized protein LOC141972375 isoform X2 n=1 Tax=Athene noctua TaxID=126797 RepID=UPI003EBF13C1
MDALCASLEQTRSLASVALGVAIIILFFLLVSPCILRVGMDALCASLEQTRSLARCREAEPNPRGSYSPTRFYRNLYRAQGTPDTPSPKSLGPARPRRGGG